MSDIVKRFSIAGGTDHSIFLTQNFEPYACGYNNKRQCGILPTASQGVDIQSVAKVPGFNNKKVISVAVGDWYSYFITKVYSLGDNQSGECGIDDDENYQESYSSRMIKKPTQVETFKNKKVIQVACGGDHVLFLTDEFNSYSCGRNAEGRLGRVTTHNEDKTPKIIKFPTNEQIIEVSNSYSHNFFLTKQNECYGCGMCSSGQLGIGVDKVNGNNFAVTPVKCLLPEYIKVIQVECGDVITHFLSSTNEVYFTGKAIEQYKKSTLLPILLTFPKYIKNQKIIQMSSGLSSNCIFLASSGKCFISSDITDSGHANYNWYNVDLKKRVVQVACGSDYFFVLTADGKVYGLGFNSHSKLGHNNEFTKLMPILVPNLPMIQTVDLIRKSDIHSTKKKMYSLVQQKIYVNIKISTVFV